MKTPDLRYSLLLFMLVVVSLTMQACTNDFYLSEREVAAYKSALATSSSANMYFDNLQGRSIDLQFESSTTPPRLLSSNLLEEMRRTELAELENGASAISLDRLREELEKQIDTWIQGKLQLYTNNRDSDASLKQLSSVNVSVMNNPTFTYDANRQSISFDGRVTIVINATVEVTGVNWLIDFFANINGTYPLQVVINELRLQGEASIVSPYADSGRIAFKLVPQLLGRIDVNEINGSVPSEIRSGLSTLLASNLSVPVDEVFTTNYSYFSLTNLNLSQSAPQTESLLSLTYRSKTSALNPAESTNPLLHTVIRTTGGKLYHSRKSSAAWSDYIPVPMPSPASTPLPAINSDPTLVHSGGDNLELAATDAQGNLFYAHWRDERWSESRLIGPSNSNPVIYYRGKPALVASAPGQVEVIVIGSDGRLWHVRRLNGIWAPAVALPSFASIPLPYRDPTAVQVGNRIVVVSVDASNRLVGQVFNMESGLWASASVIVTQETVQYAPQAVTWNDMQTDQVTVVNVGQSGRAFQRNLDLNQNNGYSYSGETMIGGLIFNSSPALVASGFRQLELIGRGQGNRLQHNHFVNAGAPFTIDGVTVNPGWQGWRTLTENISTTLTATEGVMSEFSLAATTTGRVELVARTFIEHSSVGTVFHNSYEAARFGRAPWKTVQWRGYDSTNSHKAEGQPALVAVDRNFHLAFESPVSGNPGNRFNYARLSASNLTSFTNGQAVRTGIAFPINPVVLSSGIGMTDHFYIGDDNRLHHDRAYSNGEGQPYVLNYPAGLALASQLTADSYGNGNIDVAALMSDGRVYHWMYRDRSWSGPTAATGGSIASTPVLMYVGSGQIELMAIDMDHKLGRWRYINGAWSAKIPVSSTFRINEVLFGPASASTWGDGTIDVAVVDLDTKELNHRRIGPGDEVCTLPTGCPAPRVFSRMGGNVIDTPVINAFSPTVINILTMQGQLTWFSSWSNIAPTQPIVVPPLQDPVLTWSGFENTGGKEMVVGAAANAGRNTYVATAIGLDGRLMINRNKDRRWTGFQHLSAQRPEMILTSPIVLPALAAHGN